MNEAVHAAKAESQIKGVPARLQAVQEKPAQYAVRAVERAVYSEVTITADRGTVTLATSCAEATRTREYTSESALERAFTNTGMNEFLRANGANPTRVRERAASAIGPRRSHDLENPTGAVAAAARGVAADCQCCWQGGTTRRRPVVWAKSARQALDDAVGAPAPCAVGSPRGYAGTGKTGRNA